MVGMDKQTVVLAGVGGSGVVWVGTLLARAGLRKYNHVARLPNFTTAMRGGSCECMVAFSDSRIATPLVLYGDALVILANSQLKAFENRVRPGGMILLESTGLQDGVQRNDVEVLKVPAVETATNIGNTLVSSMVLLGAYVQASKIFPPDLIEKEIEARFGVSETGITSSKTQVLLEHNLGAYREGLRIGEKQKA